MACLVGWFGHDAVAGGVTAKGSQTRERYRSRESVGGVVERKGVEESSRFVSTENRRGGSSGRNDVASCVENHDLDDASFATERQTCITGDDLWRRPYSVSEGSLNYWALRTLAPAVCPPVARLFRHPLMTFVVNYPASCLFD